MIQQLTLGGVTHSFTSLLFSGAEPEILSGSLEFIVPDGSTPSPAQQRLHSSFVFSLTVHFRSQSCNEQGGSQPTSANCFSYRAFPSMQKLEFNRAVEEVMRHDARFAAEAYGFLHEALDHTLKLRRKTRETKDSREAREARQAAGTGEEDRHVSGQQLLDGIRQYALKQFGPMVPVVLEYWGIRCCEDFGQIVFNLIGVGILGKTERDCIEDFRGGYTFEEAFVAPFRPDGVVSGGDAQEAAGGLRKLS